MAVEHPLIIVHEVAVEVFSDQDKAMTLNRWKLNRIDNIATGIWVAQACQCLTMVLSSGLPSQKRPNLPPNWPLLRTVSRPLRVLLASVLIANPAGLYMVAMHPNCQVFFPLLLTTLSHFLPFLSLSFT